MAIISVELSNTFNEFRTISNQVIERVNEFESGSATANINYLTANTIVVNTEVLSNVFSTSSNTANVTISTNGGENTSFITIESGDNGNVSIVANGTGTLFLHAANTVVGNGAIDSTLTSNGAYDLIINTNSGTNSGFIRLYDGVNGNIVIEPNGTGDLQVNADTVRIGDNNVDAILTTQGTGDLILSTNSGTNSGTVRIYDGAAGNIAIEPNGAGDIHLIADTTRLGSSNENVVLTTNGTGDVTINTNAGTNSGSIKIFDGVNGNVDITTNGTGKTNIKNITTANAIVSTIATGTAPFTVASTTVVTNLNADQIDGKHVATLSEAGGLVYASSTTEISGASAGVAGQAVISGGAGAPTYQSISSSNGASTIIARDANGDFSSRNITGSNIIGNGSQLSSLNASNLTSGTIANIRTTGNSSNSASTLVLRDANGSFSANAVTVTTINATNFAGNGSQLSNLNASNIATGTIANARTTGASANGGSTLVLRDANGDFAGRTITTTNIIGNGSQLTNLNASNIATGTIANARTTGASSNGANSLVLRDANGDFAGRRITSTIATGTSPFVVASTTVVSNLNADQVDGKNVGTLSAAGGIVYASSTSALAGTGAGTAGQAVISGGAGAPTFQTIASANGASTIIARDADGSFAANVITAETIVTGGIGGDGSLLYNLNASNIATGTISNARTTGASANGGSTLVLRDANGDFAGRTITTTNIIGNGSQLTNLNASNIATGTIANARTTGASANGANTLVLRDANGDFAGRNVTTVNVIGNGSQLTNLNASNIATGTIDNARTTANTSNSASTLVLRDANGDFAARRITSTIATGTSPFVVASTTSVTNLNSDKVDGKDIGTLSAAGGIVYASSTSALAGTGAGTAGQAVISGGAGAPTFQTIASSNGASTIIARDADGSFAANVITTNILIAGGVGGDGSQLTSLNASNIATGTISNDRTTANTSNSASTLVLRDANGDFSSRRITSTIANGTSPFVVASSTVVTNLNADQVDGKNVGTLSATGGIVYATSTSSIAGTGAGTAGQAVISGGAGAPTFKTIASANGASTIIARDALGSFAANVVTAELAGNAATATKLATARTIFLSGDVAGSATFDGSGNTTISATIQSNSVALGTDTTGNYVASVAAGSGIAVTGTAGEGWTATVAHADTSTQSSVNNSNGTVIQDITLDDFGHITAIGSYDLDNRYYTETEIDANFANLNNLSSANTANTIVLRTEHGSFGANGALISDLNASNIATGTIANARTTGASSNGANSLVLRDANGDFAGRRITSTIATGTSPFVVASTTVVSNLNADQLDGIQGASLLRSDATDAYTSGTLTFNSGTTLTAANGATVNFSNVTGTAPFAVASTTAVTNLNADLLDGQQGSYYLNWTNVTNKPDPVVTVTLTGDVAGSANTTLTDLASGTVSIATTIQANSVALGTDTTGNYVAGISAGTSITVSGSGSENATVTINHADTSTLTGAQGGNGIAGFTIDGLGHITAVTTATYLTSSTQSTDFKTVTVSDTNSGYTWATTGSAVGDAVGDTLTIVDGNGVDISVDATNDAILIQHTDTSTLSGAYGTNGVSSITVDGFGHVTAVSTATYLTSQSSDFGNIKIDNTDTEYTWVITDATTIVADTTADTATFVAAKTGSTYGIQLKANTSLDAIGIAHADTSTLTGLQGGNGIASVTVDEMGHVTAVGTATYLTSQSTDFKTVTVSDTNSGYTWATTGSAVGDAVGDTLTIVDGDGVDISVDASNDAILIQHTDTSSQASVNNSNGTVIQDITLDGFGHITAIGSVDLDSRYLAFRTLEVTDTNSGYTWSSTGNAVADLYNDTVKFVDGNGVDISVDATNDAILIQHTDTSTITGAQGGSGIAGFTIDGFGHITAVTTATYLTSQSSDFGNIKIDNTDTEYTWVITDATTIVADTTADTATFVAAKTGSTYGIQLKANTALDAIGIAHADTSTLSGAYGTNGVSSITVDEMGHVTAVGTATYLTAESDTLQTVTSRGATTTAAISITNTTASTSTTTGALKVSGGVGIQGALNATSKSFIIKHPTKDGMLLRYGSLEGPELGVYVRGKTTSKIIELPDYWTNLVHEDTITVNLTAIGKHQNLYVVKIENNCVYIENDSDEISCFYTIYGERKDVDKLVVEYADEE